MFRSPENAYLFPAKRFAKREIHLIYSVRVRFLCERFTDTVSYLALHHVNAKRYLCAKDPECVKP